MPDDDERDPSARSSRRRRWEVKSKESFESGLAVETTSPDKTEKSSNERKKVKDTRASQKDRHGIDVCTNRAGKQDSSAINGMSEKISAILNDATTSKEIEDKILDDGLISSEMQCRSPCPPYYESSMPTAPPFTPPLDSANQSPLKGILPLSPPQYEVNTISSRITQQLHKLSDDIIESKVGNKAQIPGLPISGLLVGPASSSAFSGNVSTVYCEKLNNFVVASDEQHILTRKNDHNHEQGIKESRASHALLLQSGFRTISVLCQGIFAGIAIAHCILVFILQEDFSIFFKVIPLEHAFYALQIFFSAVCVVAAFDRCDLAGQGIFSGNGLRIPWTPCFYFVTFILSLVMIRTEDFITHYSVYPEAVQDMKDGLITWWKYMALSRSVLAVLAWIAVVKSPNTDALSSRIAELVEQ